MKQTLLLLSLTFAFNAFASESCSILISTDKLNLSVLEKSKLELILEEKHYSLNKFDPFSMKPVFYIDGIEPQGENEKGEPLFKVSRFKEYTGGGMVGGMGGGMGGVYLAGGIGGGLNDEGANPFVEFETVSFNNLEVVLKKGSKTVKILETKKNLFEKEKGSAGFVAIKSIVDNLPKCKKEKKVARDDSSRGLMYKDGMGYGMYGYGGGLGGGFMPMNMGSSASGW